MRKILVLSGKRGGYGAMKPMLQLLSRDSEIELQLVLTDQHLNPAFGETINEVRRDFKVAATVNMAQEGDGKNHRSQALGRCIIGLTEVFEMLQPDICVLYGDRGEVLSAAVAATTMHIPIAHLQGGDLSGSVDDQMRHAVTKLSHLHLVSNKFSAERIHKMGEESSRIHVIGDNHIDQILSKQYTAPQQVATLLNLDLSKPIIVLLQHSETTAPEDSYGQMTETLLAIKETGHQTVVIYPCSDAGYGGIVKSIQELAITDQFRVKLNLDAEIFWGLLGVASVLVGNSSAGIVETPCFGLPTVNVGRRQENRLYSENVIHVSHDKAEIYNAIQKALTDQNFIKSARNCNNPYGDGRAGERAAEILKTVKLDPSFFIKRMTY